MPVLTGYDPSPYIVGCAGALCLVEAHGRVKPMGRARPWRWGGGGMRCWCDS